MPHEVRMARLGRIVAAGFPHQVTQRGNRRQTIFFESADYALYRDLLAERCRERAPRNEQWVRCHRNWQCQDSGTRPGPGFAERIPPSKTCQYNSKRGKDGRRLIRLH
jgi:hypothetical protein